MYRLIYFFRFIFLIPIVILSIISRFKKKNKIGIGPTQLLTQFITKNVSRVLDIPLKHL